MKPGKTFIFLVFYAALLDVQRLPAQIQASCAPRLGWAGG